MLLRQDFTEFFNPPLLDSTFILWSGLFEGFRHSADFHGRVVFLDSEAFRPGVAWRG